MPDLKTSQNQFYRASEPIKIKKIRGFISTDDGLSKIADRQIEFKMDTQLTLKEFFEILVYQGVNIVTRLKDDVKPRDQDQDQAKNKNKNKKKIKPVLKDKIFMAHYKGSLKKLLKRIQLSSGVFYDYSDSVLVVKETNPVYIKVIMPGMQDKLIDFLKSYGIENAFYDGLSNRIVFESDYFKYSKLREYFRNNNYLTLVNFDVLIVESEQETAQDFGVDWSTISLLVDNTLKGEAKIKIDGFTNDGSYSVDMGWDFISLSGFFKSIQKIQDFKILQLAKISSLNGGQCILDVSEKVPYVSEVTLGSLTDSSNSIVQGYKFATAVSGLVITLKPNVVDNFITLNFKAEIQNIPEFIEVGTDKKITQPVVSVRNIQNDLIIYPGRVQLVGGLQYSNGSIRKSGLIDVLDKLGLRSESGRRFNLNVFLRSEIIKYIFV
jgi:hypothetical protein